MLINNNKMDYTMYIIINNDLKMEKGKIASQVGHAVQQIIENILEDYYVKQKKPDIYNRYKLWSNGSKKIILKASYNDLLDLQQESECVSIYDAGKTQIQANSLTCVGFYPSCYIGEKLTKYKLL